MLSNNYNRVAVHLVMTCWSVVSGSIVGLKATAQFCVVLGRYLSLPTSVRNDMIGNYIK